MLAIIQEIGVIRSVIIAACFGFLLGMLAVIVGERRKTKESVDVSGIPLHANCRCSIAPFTNDEPHFSDNFHEERGDID